MQFKIVLSVLFFAFTTSLAAQVRIQRDSRDHQFGVFFGTEINPKVNKEKDGYAFGNNLALRAEFIDLYESFGVYFDMKGILKKEYHQQPDVYKDDLYFVPSSSRISPKNTTISRTFGFNYQLMEFIHFNLGFTFAKFNTGYDVQYFNPNNGRVSIVEYGETEKEVKPEFGVGITLTQWLKVGGNYNMVYKSMAFNVQLGYFLFVDGESKVGDVNIGGGSKKPRKPKKSKSNYKGAKYFGL